MAKRVDDRTLYMREWRKKNRARYLKYRAAWRKKHRKKVAKQQRDWREGNREAFDAYQKAYREAHKAEISAYNKAYREAHREQRRATHRRWAKKHPDRLAAAGRVSLAKERYPGNLTIDDVLLVIARSGNRCHWCGKQDLQGRDLTLEHLKPVNDVAELVIACRSCNCSQLHRGQE